MASLSRTILRAAPIAALALVTAATTAHDNDPKKRTRPPIYGETIYGGQDGIAGGWGGASDGFIFCAQIPVNQLGGSGNGSDCWGYTSPSGREYAIVTMESAVAWVEVSDPFNPQVLYTYQRGGTGSLWCDVKVVGSRAYVVGEGGGSIKTFNMSNIDNGVVTYIGESSSDGGSASHNIASVPQANLIARCGGGSNGLRFYSTSSNPNNPQFIGAWNDRYVHDACLTVYPQNGPDAAYRGRIIGFLNDGLNGGSTNTGLSIVDFGTPQNFNPSGTLLSRVTWPGAGYSHQSWHNDDFTWVISNDETALNSTWQMVNITDLDNASLGIQQSIPGTAVNHNNYVHEGRLYAANYSMGVRVLDCTNGNFMTEVAYFDTYPENDGASFNGVWSVYPYFESGTIIASDFQRGLFVLKLDLSPIGFSFPDGLPDVVPSSGASLVMETSLESGFEVESVEMAYDFAAGADGTVVGQAIGSNRYSFQLPASANCPDEVEFSFSAALTNGDTYSDPGGTYGAIVADGSVVAGEWNGNSSAGWTLGLPSDTATDGQWDRGQPDGNNRGDPPTDGSGSPSGQAFFTDLDSSTENSDVDGGFTTLLSPVFDGTAVEGGVISYQRWYDDLFGAAPGLDQMDISISNNGGSSWTLLETVTESPGVWVQVEFPVDAVLTPTSQMQLRFVVGDYNDGSVVEAGIDNLRIFGLECDDSLPGDLNGDGLVNGADVGIFLALWGTSNPDADLNGNGTVEGGDLGLLIANWTG
ncbi:MAG: hypothetical protein CMJ34_07420 [Phycisphaerae bacterium]|nr:hypothetical protein [Phycisphaerae bacterium]